MTTLLEDLFSGITGRERDEAIKGLAAVLRAAPGGGRRAFEIDAVLVDSLVEPLTRRLWAQVDEILHHPAVQRLEAAWRGVRFVVDRAQFSENIAIELCNVTKQNLADDFADAAEITTSGLYRLVYSTAFATFGGKPYALLCADFEFGPGAEDMGLLRKCASVSAMAHSPFIANVGADFFGLRSFADFPRVRDLGAILSGPRYRLWHSFRDTEDARYVGLCLPRFLLRAPYRPDTDPFQPLRFREHVEDDHEHHLWGHACFAFAARCADSFARYRWCVYLIGSRASGMVEDLVRHEFPTMRGLTARAPTECILTTRTEHVLSDEGFVGLVYDRASGNAMFHSAASAHKPRRFADTEEGRAAWTGERLGAQLPYVFLVSRLAHFLKWVQREKIGQWNDKGALQRELDLWLRQYVSDVDDPHWETRARRPLRKAAIQIEVVPGQSGWYRCHLKLQPHLTHNSASFSLALLGRLERIADAREE
ncbi:MAG: type VI secretion system contractile sheath large subunit [Myxococcales bacterium]|nr:type VI secretion system contractile sheath large subunit [Myxococcales bacterium]